MKTQILLEGAVGRVGRLLESFTREAGRVPDDPQALQSLANCTTLALESEGFEHVCASLRTEWSSCAEYHGLFNVAMDMDLKSEVNVLLKEAAAIAAEGTMIEALNDEALDDDEAADDHMELLRVFENQLKELETCGYTDDGGRRALQEKHAALKTRAHKKEGPNFLNVPWPTSLHKTPQQFCDWCVL